jgi:integrase
LVKRYVTNFCEHYGNQTCEAVVAKCETIFPRWLASNRGWVSSETQRRGVATVQAMFNFGADKHGMRVNKLASYPLPEESPRETYFNEAQEAAIIAALKLRRFRDEGEFADFFTICIETGGRTYIEASRFTAANLEWRNGKPAFFDLGVVKKKKHRFVWLSPKAQEIVLRLLAKYPTGPLFRNRAGLPWGKTTTARRIKVVVNYLRKKRPELGLTDRHTPYCCRHSFVVRKLAETRGDVVLVAEMCGNTIGVLMKSYAKHCANDSRIMEALGHKPA